LSSIKIGYNGHDARTTVPAPPPLTNNTNKTNCKEINAKAGGAGCDPRFSLIDPSTAQSPAFEDGGTESAASFDKLRTLSSSKCRVNP